MKRTSIKRKALQRTRIRRKRKRDAKWERVRKLARKRAEGKCEDCGREGGDGHHIQSRGAHPELKYELTNIAWLCRLCHQARHQGSKPCPAKGQREGR